MKTFIMKKRSVLWILCLCMSLLLVSCNGADSRQPAESGTTQSTGAEDSQQSVSSGTSGYFTLDINPSVEFIVRDGKVVKLKAANDDASVLLSGEDFIGLTVEEASEKITKLSEKMGYLNADNDQVKINVISGDPTSQEEIESAARTGAANGSDVAKVSTTSRAHENRIVKDLQKQNPELYKNLTAEKVRLIDSIMKYDSTMTYEKGTAMEVSELLDIREDLMDEYEDMISEDLEDQFEAKYDERKQAVDEKIAAVYAKAYADLHKDLPTAEDDYMKLYRANIRLDALLDQWEDEWENQSLTDEDVQAVLDILSAFRTAKGGQPVEKAEIADENGQVNEASIEHFLDTLAESEEEETTGVETTGTASDTEADEDEDEDEEEDEATGKSGDDLDALEDALEEILDRYDEDNCRLTEAQITELKTLLTEAGVEAELSADMIMEDVEDLLDPVEEQFEAWEEEAEDALTDEQKAAVDGLEAEKDEIKAQVRADMQDEIQKEAERVAAEKKAKLEG